MRYMRWGSNVRMARLTPCLLSRHLLFEEHSDERTVEEDCQLFSCHNGREFFYRCPSQQPDSGLDLLGEPYNFS